MDNASVAENIQPQQQEQQEQQEAPQKKEDLIQRVSQHKPNTESESQSEVNFNINDIEKIEDPLAKEYAQKAYKSFQRGFNQKFQELAELKKQVESERSEFSNWTPEKVQGLLQDQNFVNAAQSVYQSNQPNPPNSGMSDEEWSVLSDRERAKINEIDMKYKQQDQKLNRLLLEKEDESLAKRYANYNSEKVNKIQSDLLSGNMQATREHLWKVLDYENAVERAYQLGLQDRKVEVNEKINAISPDGVSISQSDDIPQKNENESDRDYFRRLALRRLAQRQQTQRR